MQKGNEIQRSCNHWKSVHMNEIQLIEVWEFRVIIVLVVVLCFIECECRFGDPHGVVHNPPMSPCLHSAHNSFDILQVSDDGGQVLQEDYSHQGHIFTIWFCRPDQCQKQCELQESPHILSSSKLQTRMCSNWPYMMTMISMSVPAGVPPLSPGSWWISNYARRLSMLYSSFVATVWHTQTNGLSQHDSQYLWKDSSVDSIPPITDAYIAWTRMTLCEGYSQGFSWIAHQGLLWGK